MNASIVCLFMNVFIKANTEQKKKKELNLKLKSLIWFLNLIWYNCTQGIV